VSLRAPAVEERRESRRKAAALELGVQREDLVRHTGAQAQDLGDDRGFVATVDAEQLVERRQGRRQLHVR